MGRPIKEGLDYFELDCQLDDKIKLIQAEYGLKGFAVVVKLFQKIYGGCGYYCEWTEDVLLLFMSENGLDCESKNLIGNIVEACIRRHIFSEDLFKKYHILTSSGIQKRYLNAVARRENVKLKKEYLLVKVDKKYISADKNRVSAYINSVNACGNTQSREEKSREENINNSSSADKPHTPTAKQMIEERSFSPSFAETVKDWVRYKIEKHQGYKATGLRNLLTQIENSVQEYGEQPVEKAIRYSMANNYKGIIWERIRSESSSSSPAKTKPEKGLSSNKFNNFQQREYDFTNLEASLLGNGGKE